MRLDGEENVEVAGRTATHARFPLSGKADAGAVFDTGGNVHGKRALAADAARAVAGLTGIIDDFATPLTGRAGSLDRKKTLLGAHAPLAAAGGAGFRLRSRFGADARTRLARDRGRHFEACRLAGKGLFQRDFHIVTKIRAALAAGRAAPPPHHVAEEIVENVGHGGGEALAHAEPSAAAAVEGGMAEAVVGGALLR